MKRTTKMAGITGVSKIKFISLVLMAGLFTVCKKDKPTVPIFTEDNLDFDYRPSSMTDGEALISEFLKYNKNPHQKAGKIMLDQAIWEMEASANYEHRATEYQELEIVGEEEIEFDIPVEINGAGKLKVSRSDINAKYNLLMNSLQSSLSTHNSGIPIFNQKVVDFIDVEVEPSNIGGHVKIIAKSYFGGKKIISWVLRNSYHGETWALLKIIPIEPQIYACVIQSGSSAGSNINYNLATEMTKGFVKIRRVGQYDVSIASLGFYPNLSVLADPATLPCVGSNSVKMLYNNQMSNYIFNTANTGDVSEFHANYWIKKMSEIIKIVENGYNADALQLQVYSSAGWCSGSDCCLKKYYHRINITLGEVYDTPSPLGL